MARGADGRETEASPFPDPLIIMIPNVLSWRTRQEFYALAKKAGKTRENTEGPCDPIKQKKGNGTKDAGQKAGEPSTHTSPEEARLVFEATLQADKENFGHSGVT